MFRFMQWDKEMSGLDSMKKRVLFDGGDTPDSRLVHGKYRSFKASLERSYQAEWIILNDRRQRCLINADKLTNEYDQKEISIDFDTKIKVGDVFYWERTNSYWLVYSQKLEEEAYFHAQIRRCDYQINGWWVYIKPPAETEISWSQKHNTELNSLNYTVSLYVEKTEETLEYFKRFQVVKFDEHNWRVSAVNRYSQTGLLEVSLEEYFDNTMEDAMIQPKEEDIDKTKPYIDGPSAVNPYDTDITYTLVNHEPTGKFVVNSSKIEVVNQTETSITLNVITGKSGSFVLGYYVNKVKVLESTIKINSLI